MGKTVKTITVYWTPQGDPARILGWNVIVNGNASDPTASPVYHQVFVPAPRGSDYSWIGQQRSVQLSHVLVDGGASVYAWVQQVYRSGDSEWISSAGTTAPDDGIATAGDLLGPENTAGKGVEIIPGGIQSKDFQQPTGADQGQGFRILDGALEAYGANHAFGGPTFFTDGNFMITVGLTLKSGSLTKRYPAPGDFDIDGQIHLYKWGGSAWTQFAILGLATTWTGDTTIFRASGSQVGGDFTGTSFGVQGTTGGGTAGYFEANGDGGIGVYGKAIAVVTGSNGKYGGVFESDGAQIRLIPGTYVGPPTWLTAEKGALYLDANCVLWVNTDGGTTWQKVGAQ